MYHRINLTDKSTSLIEREKMNKYSDDDIALWIDCVCESEIEKYGYLTIAKIERICQMFGFVEYRGRCWDFAKTDDESFNWGIIENGCLDTIRRLSEKYYAIECDPIFYINDGTYFYNVEGKNTDKGYWKPVMFVNRDCGKFDGLYKMNNIKEWYWSYKSYFDVMDEEDVLFLYETLLKNCVKNGMWNEEKERKLKEDCMSYLKD